MVTRSAPATELPRAIKRRASGAKSPASPEGRNRLVMLTPEGSFSFRMRSFPLDTDAVAFIRDGGILVRDSQWAAFWTHDSKPEATAGPAEVVAMLRDISQPEIVNLYSF